MGGLKIKTVKKTVQEQGTRLEMPKFEKHSLRIYIY
jgi:uncharacterized protein YcgL (UPF0745 family)